jgi:hypothetical protein
MSLRIIFLTSAIALTACGAAATGRSTMPSTVDATTDVAPASPSTTAQPHADPALPNKQVDISAEGAFASSK